MRVIQPRPRGLRQAQTLAIGAGKRDQLLDSGRDVLAAISHLGGRVRFTSNPKALISVEPDLTFEIEGSTFTSLSRETFSYAVALGHYFLHAFPTLAPSSGAPTRMVALYDGNSDDHDFIKSRFEANWFAFGMLMPEKEFRRVLAESGIDGAAAHFDVPPGLAGLRASMRPVDEN